jgi:biopolymer transport protein ExbB/TolQ/tetratricopeptide (TPR) repeat protein
MEIRAGGQSRSARGLQDARPDPVSGKVKTMNARSLKHVRNLFLFCLMAVLLVAVQLVVNARPRIDFGALAGLFQKTSMIRIFLKGGPIMWPLSCASILALGTVIDRVIFLLNERRKRDPRAVKEFFAAVDRKDMAGALHISETSDFYIVRILGYALAQRDKSLAGALLYAQEKELRRFRGGIATLDTVITLAPLLGLLGTVTGMMGSFSLIGGELSAPGAVTGGIAEALIATAFGLGIAITSLIPFNILNTRLEDARHEIESAAKELELRLHPPAKRRTMVPQITNASPPRTGAGPFRRHARVPAGAAEALVPLKRLALSLLILTAAARADAQTGTASLAPEWSQSVLAVWNDPIFQKQFIAGYGVNSEVEPRVTVEEVTILEKIRPLMAQDLPKAEELLKKQIKPDCSAILDFTLGGIYFQQDKMPEALANYLKAVGKFPSFRRAWRNLGLIYARDGKYDDAINAFTKMIELGGGDAYSYGLLGFAYAAKQDYQAAEAAYRNALLLQPQNTQWRLGLTRCVFRQQKFEDAVTLLEVLIARNPEQADFWLLQAQAYLGMKQPLQAAEDIEAVNRLGKGTLDSLYTLGDIYVNEGLVDLGARTYLRAIDADAQQPAGRPLRCAEVLAARGALTQARQVSTHILEVWDSRIEDADRRRLLKLEARLNMAEGGSSPETAKVLEEIVKIDPLDGEALMLLGQHYGHQNEPDRAMFYYERAESLEAFEVNARIRHAQVLVGLKRYAEALPLLRRAQELKPREDVQKYLDQVERLAKSH